MRRWTVAAAPVLAAALLLGPCQAWDISPHKIAGKIKDAAPKKLKEALKGPSKDKLLDGIQDALNRSGLQKVSEAMDNPSASKIAEALQDSTGNATKAVEAANPKKKINDAVHSLGQKIQDLGRAMNGSSADAVGDSLKAVAAGQMGDQVSTVTDGAKVADALNKTGQQLSEALQGGIPRVAKVLNRTGLRAAKALKERAPQVAGALKDPRSEKIDALFSGGATKSEEVPDEDAGWGWWPVLSVLALSAVGAGGWQFLRNKRERRAPLLVESEMNLCNVQHGSQRRGVSITAEEPLFTQF